MRYRTLGRTGIKVSAYALGAMMFGAIGNPDHDDSIRIIHKALDAGINVIDTAPVYSNGESEEIVERRSRDAGTPSSSRPRCSRERWFPGRTQQRTIPTGEATQGAGSRPRSRTRCAACQLMCDTWSRKWEQRSAAAGL